MFPEVLDIFLLVISHCRSCSFSIIANFYWCSKHKRDQDLLLLRHAREDDVISLFLVFVYIKIFTNSFIFIKIINLNILIFSPAVDSTFPIIHVIFAFDDFLNESNGSNITDIANSRKSIRQIFFMLLFLNQFMYKDKVLTEIVQNTERGSIIFDNTTLKRFQGIIFSPIGCILKNHQT